MAVSQQSQVETLFELQEKATAIQVAAVQFGAAVLDSNLSDELKAVLMTLVYGSFASIDPVLSAFDETRAAFGF
jgi:hypothetical protein